MKNRKTGQRYLAMMLVLILLSGIYTAVPVQVCASESESAAEAEEEREEDHVCDMDDFPQWTLETVTNDAGNTVSDENGVYYFGKELAVSFQMEEEGFVLKRDGTDLVQNGGSYTDSLYETGTYVYTVESEDGCIGTESVSITAVKVCEPPSVSVSYGTDPADLDGKLYFREAPDAILHAEAPAGIAKIEYRTAEEDQLLADFQNEDSYRYGENTICETALKDQSAFAEILSDIQERDYRWSFRVTDVLGNVAEKEMAFAVDRTAPDVRVYVAYHADGTNPETPSDTGILELAGSFLDRLFGKARIEFDLYIRDSAESYEDGYEPSGIDLEDLKDQIMAVDGHAAVQEVHAAEKGLISFAFNETVYERYAHIRGSMTVPLDGRQDVKERLCIARLKDRAGNITDEVHMETLTGTAVLYFDQVSPVLSVNYDDGIIDETRKAVFYKETATIGLCLTEENYQDYVKENGTPVMPRICMNDRDNGGMSAEEWEPEGSGMHTKLRCPALSSKGEAAYEFTVEYQDGSGNHLVTDGSCPGYAEDGIYTGYTVVVDNQAPVLTDFSIDGKTNGRRDGANVYENTDGEDVILSFTLDDHPSYWDPERVKLIIINQETKEQAAVVDGRRILWETDGRSHHGTWGFDGEGPDGVFCYEASICYEDCAGNRLMGGSEFKDKVTEGIYKSETFILDHEAPEFDISYQKAVRLVCDENKDPSCDLTEEIPRTGYTAYYRDPVQICFSIRDSCMEPVYQGTEITGLRDFRLEVTGEEQMLYEPTVRWKKEKDAYTGSFFLNGEDRYRVLVSCQDLAGNVMVPGQTEGSRWEEAVSEEGWYESVFLVLDRTAPVIRTSFADIAKNGKQAEHVFEKDQSTFFSEPVFLKLEVEDRNLRFYELVNILKKIKVSDCAGNPVSDSSIFPFLEGIDQTETGFGSFVFYLPFLTDAVYELPVGCADLAGNMAVSETKKISVDRGSPELELFCSVEKSGFLDAVRYRNIRCLFADSRMTVRALAKDTVSGIRMIRYTMQGQDGTTMEKTEHYDPADRRECVFCVPVYGADFKGTVITEVWDWSGNYTVQEQGHIVESAERHTDTGMIRLETVTQPGRTVGDVDYYNSDVVFRMTVEDTYSGLKRISCKGGKSIDRSIDYAEEAKNAPAGEQKEGIVYGYTEELVLKAADNNANDVPVRVEYQDNAGHMGILEQMYQIDITPPEVTVEYDNNEPSDAGFYNRSRTAVVTVKERNFDPSDVEFRITSTGGNMPEIEAWETSGTGDETLHQCQILFQEDDDYTFTLMFMDLAGNRAEYERVDEFTIDQTAPVLTVNYDSGKSDSQEYYAESRTAVIDILEHNFDASLIRIAVEEKDGGTVPSISAWSENGDHHTASLTFDADGEYTFGITGMDRAENEMEAYDTVRFIIDQTAPELVISGVEHRSANNGITAPQIRCTDRNYMAGSMEIRLEGYAHGVLETKGIRIQREREEEYRMEDFSWEPETDDLYRLVVQARDLAGNESTEEVIFSVNRFGSVYTLEDKTELLAGSRGVYYTNTEQDIIVTETNVDLLEAQEITCSLNGILRTLQEGADYYVDRSETEESWKQYTYVIPKHNFEQEGTYILTIYSEDRAENVSDNHTKGKQIEFAVDKTSPSILLSGLEEGGRYREHSREVTLDIQDNVKTAEVKVAINGVVSTYLASEVLKQNGRITLMAGSSRQWQSIHVTACDAAGNRQELERKNFLITPDLLVQFFMNKTLFYGSLGVLVFLWAAAWRLFFRRRRIHSHPLK